MTLDPIVTSVIQHRLHAIVEEMGEAMLRTAATSRARSATSTAA
jgi:N-methylhydantoinase B/oxoprolinase/acetone carboxylase alpha subunit